MSAAQKFLNGDFCSVSSAPACSVTGKKNIRRGKPNLLPPSERFQCSDFSQPSAVFRCLRSEPALP